MMLDAGFPQLFSSTMIGQFEADRRFVLLEFARTNFDVEIVALVRDFEDLWPGKTIDTQSETHDKRTTFSV